MKRNFQLAGAVLSIIVGAFAILGGFLALSLISMFSDMPSVQLIMLLSGVLVVLLGIAIVLLGALLCRKKNSVGIAIALLVLTSLTAVLQITGTEKLNGGSILMIMLQLTAVAMLLVYLILKEKKEILPTEEAPQNIAETSVEQTDSENSQ